MTFILLRLWRPVLETESVLACSWALLLVMVSELVVALAMQFGLETESVLEAQ
jgi:hypothetical protein